LGVPQKVVFDRYALMTKGEEQISSPSFPFIVNPTGMSIVTGWLTSGIWNTCYDPITTTWSACYSAVTTVWSACYSAVSTIWTSI
jgi:hypothetical protein